MSQRVKVSLIEAEKVARAMTALLAPVCERVEVAGSIRRRRALVGDVELVLMPRIEERVVPLAEAQQSSLFDTPKPKTQRVNLLHERLDALLVAASPRGQPLDWEPPKAEDAHWMLAKGDKWGDRYRKLEADYWQRPAPHGEGCGWPVGIDLFMVPDPRQWGYVFLVRTGSAEFSQWFVKRLHGKRLRGHEGYVRKTTGRLEPDTSEAGLVETPDEAACFALVGLEVVPPELRSVRDDETLEVAQYRWTRGGRLT